MVLPYGFDSRFPHQTKQRGFYLSVLFYVGNSHRPVSDTRGVSDRVRIPHPKVDMLACQSQGVGIFAFGEIPVFASSSLSPLVIYILHIFSRTLYFCRVRLFLFFFSNSIDFSIYKCYNICAKQTEYIKQRLYLS